MAYMQLSLRGADYYYWSWDERHLAAKLGRARNAWHTHSYEQPTSWNEAVSYHCMWSRCLWNIQKQWCV